MKLFFWSNKIIGECFPLFNFDLLSYCHMQYITYFLRNSKSSVVLSYNYCVFPMCRVPCYIIFVVPNDNPERKMLKRLQKKDRNLLQVFYPVRGRAGIWALLDPTPSLVLIHCPTLSPFQVTWHNLLKDFTSSLTLVKVFLPLLLCYN